jgi:hypothetical protein
MNTDTAATASAAAQLAPEPLYGLFLGCLERGYVLMHIEDKAGIERQFYRYEAARRHSQYLVLQDPSTRDPAFRADSKGDVVVFQGNLQGGSLWGPFTDTQLANYFVRTLHLEANDLELPFHVFELAHKRT